jgi:hypothetical protein
MLRLPFLLLLGLAACAATACAAATAPVPAQPTTIPSTPDPLPSAGGTEHWLGAPNAPVTLEEYGDLQ